jgi:predicted RNase H-like HicB family nuclease
MAVATSERTRTPYDPAPPEIQRQVGELMKRPYRMVVQGEPVEGYLASVPDLPGCVTGGATPEEAVEMLQEAMAAWLESVLLRGLPVPDPAAPVAEARYSGNLRVRMPKSLHRRLAEQSKAEGVSLNQLILTYLAQGAGAAAASALVR